MTKKTYINIYDESATKKDNIIHIYMYIICPTSITKSIGVILRFEDVLQLYLNFVYTHINETSYELNDIIFK